MTRRRTFLMLIPLAVTLGETGCGGGEAPAPEVTPVAIVPHIRPELAPAGAAPAEVNLPQPVPSSTQATAASPDKPTVPTAGVSSTYPDDLASGTVQVILEPTPPPAPDLPQTTQPVPRSSLVERGELQPEWKLVPPPRLPLTEVDGPRPTPPPEGVPADLGRDAVLSRPVEMIPDPPAIRTPNPVPLSAAELPPLVTAPTMQASLVDPSANASASRVVAVPLPLPVPHQWFHPFALPPTGSVMKKPIALPAPHPAIVPPKM